MTSETCDCGTWEHFLVHFSKLTRWVFQNLLGSHFSVACLSVGGIVILVHFCPYLMRLSWCCLSATSCIFALVSQWTTLALHSAVACSWQNELAFEALSLKLCHKKSATIRAVACHYFCMIYFWYAFSMIFHDVVIWSSDRFFHDFSWSC